MNRRPVTFVDWRAIYQRTAREIGHYLPTLIDLDFQVHIDCHLWKLLQRYARIEKRLEVEHEAQDRTWVREMLYIAMYGDD